MVLPVSNGTFSSLPFSTRSPLPYFSDSGGGGGGSGSYLTPTIMTSGWSGAPGAFSAANLFLDELSPHSLPLRDPGDEADLSEVYEGSGNYSGYENGSDWRNGTTGLGEIGDGGYNYWALLLLVFSIFAVFGNMLVILSVKRERSLWNVTNYFIVSLAVADLLVAGVVMPFAILFLFNETKWRLPPITCDFYIAMDVTCSTSSILNLVAISIDRGPPNPLPQVYVGGSIAVVVFRSVAVGGTGFRLKWEASGAWRYDFVNYNDFLDGYTPGSWSYPLSEGADYEYNTLTTWVLSQNHVQVALGQRLVLNLHEVDIERCDMGCTCDFLDIYEFSGSALTTLDRFIAVTQPIKYAKHKSNTRVWLTIVFVWVFSGLVGSPIVLGLNTPLSLEEGVPMDPTSCIFHNYYFTFFSSLCSFYIPCTILVYLYYRIFKVIRERAKKAAGGTHRQPASAGGGGAGAGGGVGVGGTVIENLAQTKRLAETTLGGCGPSSLPIPSSQPEDERGTNTGSGSQEEEEDEEGEELGGGGEGDEEEEEEDEGQEVEGEEPSPDGCQIIANNRLASAFVLESVRGEERGGLREQNGNHDSGYAASNLEEGPHPVAQEPSPASPKHSLPLPLGPYKRNGLNQVSTSDPKKGGAAGGGVVRTGSGGGESSKKLKPAASRFTICKAHKASRRKKEKSSAKRERKATKTLAIVLGLFLLCWLPFFTCNIMDAICQMSRKECGISLTTFLLTTWLGYANSCLNPIIYTIFNPEFRKAFKKLMGLGA